MTLGPESPSTVPAPPTYEASQGNPITQVGLQIEDLGRRLDNISQEIDDRLRRLETAQDISKLQKLNTVHKANGLTLLTVPRADGTRPTHLPKIESGTKLVRMDAVHLEGYVTFYSEVEYPPGLTRVQLIQLVWHFIGDGPWVGKL